MGASKKPKISMDFSGTLNDILADSEEKDDSADNKEADDHNSDDENMLLDLETDQQQPSTKTRNSSPSDQTSEKYFENQLLDSRNKSNSFLWINYAKFHLKQNQIDQAKFVLEKAIEKIPFEESKERMNIFITILNIEAKYSNDDSFMKRFKNLSKRCDEKMLYSKIL